MTTIAVAMHHGYCSCCYVPWILVCICVQMTITQRMGSDPILSVQVFSYLQKLEALRGMSLQSLTSPTHHRGGSRMS